MRMLHHALFASTLVSAAALRACAVHGRVRHPVANRAPPVALSLPSFLPASAAAVEEREAQAALRAMQQATVHISSPGLEADVATTFCSREGGDEEDGELRVRLAYRLRTQPMLPPQGDVGAEGAKGGVPRVMLLHGADASSLEWRFLQPRLAALGVSSVAVDWWSGGWTDRQPILRTLEGEERPRPWPAVRQHLHAFWSQQLGGEPVVLVGASLGGAVAIDFATAYPEAVRGLVLLDSGGQSFRSPPADTVSALSPLVLGVKRALAFAQSKAPAEALRIAGMHRDAPMWAEALGTYLRSGGYQSRVTRDLIRTLTPRTLVVWGSDDQILPLEDAYAFERDLQRCIGVRVIAGAGHTPQLDEPDLVALHVAQFAVELGGAMGLVTEAGQAAEGSAPAAEGAA